jgi:hypothetical protein
MLVSKFSHFRAFTLTDEIYSDETISWPSHADSYAQSLLDCARYEHGDVEELNPDWLAYGSEYPDSTLRRNPWFNGWAFVWCGADTGSS